MSSSKKKTSSRVKFNTGGKTIGGEIAEATVPVSAASQFKESEKFYITSHPQMSDVDLAVELDKPAPLIRKYRDESSRKTTANRLLSRPAKGVVAMTEGSSMASDDRTRNLVSTAEIKAAVAAGDYEEAARLQKRMREQQGTAAKAQQTLDRGRVHYINPPEA